MITGVRSLILLLIAAIASLSGASTAERARPVEYQAANSNNKVIPVFFQPIPSSSEPTRAIKIGMLEYDVFLESGEFKPVGSSDSIHGPGCFGVNDINGNFKCLAFSNVSGMNLEKSGKS